MRVFMSSDGFVLCSLENKNRAFLHDCYRMFEGFKGGNLFMTRFTAGKEDWAYPEVGDREDHYTISEIIKNAERHGVEVEKEVYDFRDRLGKTVERLKAEAAAREVSAKKKAEWEYRCAHGCEGCRNLCYDGDVPLCKKSGRVLEEKNTVKWSDDKRTAYPFSLTPIPDKNCIYFTEE